MEDSAQSWYSTLDDYVIRQIQIENGLSNGTITIDRERDPEIFRKIMSPKLSEFDRLPKVLLVKFSDDVDLSGYKESYPQWTLSHKERFVLMGEIHQCPGHVVIVSNSVSGKILTMIHSSDLEAVPLEDA